jgi:hypothetical protein
MLGRTVSVKLGFGDLKVVGVDALIVVVGWSRKSLSSAWAFVAVGATGSRVSEWR